MDKLNSKDYKGFKINIYADDSPESPREWSNIGVMVCNHSSYNLGDKQYKNSQADNWKENFAEYVMETYSPISMVHYDTYGYLDDKGVGAVWRWINKNMVVLPLSLYDHSGISMSAGSQYPYNCRWDSSNVGFIYCTKELALAEYGGKIFTKATKQKVETYLIGEVETYNKYLTGAITGYMIEDSTGDESGGCWGFYSEEDLLDNAQSAVDALVQAANFKKLCKVKELIKAKVSLDIRNKIIKNYSVC